MYDIRFMCIFCGRVANFLYEFDDLRSCPDCLFETYTDDEDEGEEMTKTAKKDVEVLEVLQPDGQPKPWPPTLDMDVQRMLKLREIPPAVRGQVAAGFIVEYLRGVELDEDENL